MKKTIATLSIILILLNIFIPYSKSVYGASTITQESVNGYMNEGQGQLPTNQGGNGSLPLDATGNNMNGLITALLEILIVPPMIANWLMSLIATNGQSTYTIQDMLLNKYYLFDIDFFNVDDDSEEDGGNEESEDNAESDEPNKGLINVLKSNVATWYFSLRNIAIIGIALILIYVAIRIALELTRRSKRTRGFS